MTDKEINEIVKKDYAKLDNIILFVTQGSDVESHLLNPNYLASISNIPKEKIESIIQKISIENHNEFIRRFTTKRAEIKSAMRSKEKFFEKTEKILSKEIPLPIEQIVGKDMWKILKEYKENDTLIIPSNTEPKPSEWLKDQNLASLLSH
ncbi:hypothetical protein [Vogesella indigofera]|uniref:hypothetical protein n=1 Tax=Vogesella indigofera TaxID=45465 RepID=UPI00234E7E63|nr:hypothetical protein [Vogesella indigofera]MDC7698027.1 hypothetical protein [Vogesella indigofera]